MNRLSWKKLIVSMFICFMAAGIGSFFTTNAIPTWYAGLQKPWFNPPNWLFGPVWTILYVLMAISLYLVWNAKKKEGAKEAIYLIFGVQLTLNTLWSIIFFGLHNPLLGFLIIVLLWGSILVMILRMVRYMKIAGLLQIPYIVWVSFASILNLSILILNK